MKMKMRKGKVFLLLSMLIFFNLVISSTMASRAIPTGGEPVEKESQVADASGSIPYRPVFPRGRPCNPYYSCRPFRPLPPPPPPP